jgi:hypothetical protein
MGIVLGKGRKAIGEDPGDINEALGGQKVERNLQTIEIMRVAGGIITEFPPGFSHPALKDVGFSTGTEFSFIPDSVSHLGGRTDGEINRSNTADCFLVQPAHGNAARGNYVYSIVG